MFNTPHGPQGNTEPSMEHLLKSGNALVFAPAGQSSEEDQKRIIPAQWLNDLANAPERHVTVPVTIRNAIIDGPLQLQYVTFEYEFSLINCEIKHQADFSFATFCRVGAFDESKFVARANFRGSEAKGDLKFVRTRFQDCHHPAAPHADQEFGTDFEDVRVHHLFCADGASFGCVNFKRAYFSKTVFFRPGFPDAGEPVPARFTGDADFADSYVGGPAYFSGADFEQKATFSRVRFASVAVFQCHAQNGYVLRTRFRGETRFVSTRLEGGATFQGALFENQVLFDSAEVLGNLYFHEFRTEDGIALERIQNLGSVPTTITGPAGRSIPCCFHVKVSFFATHVGASLTFVGAHFKGDADFELMRIGGHALFRSSSPAGTISVTTFEKTARFFHANVKGNLEFFGTQFKGDVIFDMLEATLVSFRPLQLDNGALHCTFHKKASFDGMRVDGEAHFSGTSFMKDLKFDGVQISGKAYFDSLIHNLEPDGSTYASCQPVMFYGSAHFGNSVFKQDVNFTNAKFVRKADFGRAIVAGEGCFLGVKFEEDVSFNNSKFSAVIFDEPDELTDLEQIAAAPVARRTSDRPQFRKTVDLRGFTYERIEVNLEELLKDKIKPYDRQPYAQLEKAYRAISDDASVDKIYVQVRNCERKRMGHLVAADVRRRKLWKAVRRLPAWLVDGLHWSLTRYGTMPIMLLIMTLVFLISGAVVFKQTGAVRYKDKTDETALGAPQKLSFWSALGLSCNQFVPIVELPSGSNYKPSDNKLLGQEITFATYGTLHRLAGAVLVPTGIASLTLLLYRKGRGAES